MIIMQTAAFPQIVPSTEGWHTSWENHRHLTLLRQVIWDPILDLNSYIFGHEADRNLRAGCAARVQTKRTQQRVLYARRTMGHSWLRRTSFPRLPDVGCCCDTWSVRRVSGVHVEWFADICGSLSPVHICCWLQAFVVIYVASTIARKRRRKRCFATR